MSKPIDLKVKSDISISLEVGEHIPVEYEQIFLDNIVANTTTIVVLSWAIPGQIGNGHINCRENEYIIQQMANRGFILDKNILEKRKQFKNWFKDSLMLFTRQ